jgi:hypothetical protein
MIKTITIGLALIILASLIQAIVVYSGETYQYTTDLDEIITWKVINNNTFINASQISNKTISIFIPELSEPLSFSLEIKGYKNEEERVVYIPSNGGGGGSRLVYKNNTNTIFLNRTEYKDRIVEKEIYIEKKYPEQEKPIIPNWSVILLILITTLAIYLAILKSKRGKNGAKTNIPYKK